MKRFCFALDLVDDEKLIEEYKERHRNFWPELREHTRRSGIQKLDIYNAGNRLFMIWETDDDFDLNGDQEETDHQMEKRSAEWEEIMSEYQRPIPIAKPGEKWVLMEKIFEL